MPELPEVHTTVEGLKKVIIGQSIKGVWSDFHVGARYDDRENIKNKKYFERFKKTVVGTKIKGVERLGKNILIHLNNGCTMIVHMKMTGNLVVVGKAGARKSSRIILQKPNERFVHLKFFLSGNYDLALSDIRKFASVDLCQTEAMSLHARVGRLGPDPLDPKLSTRQLFQIMQARKSWPIKSALLDQTKLAGIGNIYSDEILWASGVHPLSRTGSIPEKKFAEIFKNMKKILKFSIKKGGDSKTDYRNAFGGKGEFQNFHQVYGRKGLRCPKPGCGGIIERKMVKGRSTHFCPKHQIIYE